MNEEEAKRQVILLYNTEYLKETGGLENRNPVIGALQFYGWLQNNHSEVLEFPFPGDRYQIVKTWVGLPWAITAGK